jgi:hypothetical protein
MKRASALRLLGIAIIIGAAIITLWTIFLSEPGITATLIAAVALRPEARRPLLSVVDVLSPDDEALLAALLGV